MVSNLKKSDELILGPKDRAIEAINRGEYEKAKESIHDLYEDFQPLHDRYLEWINFLLAFISKKLGEEVVPEAMQGLVEEIYRSIFENMKKMNHDELAKIAVNTHRPHYNHIEVAEDDEKTVITINVCNAGARLVKDCIAQRTGGLTTREWPWSFNEKDFPFYCVHTYHFNKLFKELEVPIEIKWVRGYDNQGKPTGQACTGTIRQIKS